MFYLVCLYWKENLNFFFFPAVLHLQLAVFYILKTYVQCVCTAVSGVSVERRRCHGLSVICCRVFAEAACAIFVFYSKKKKKTLTLRLKCIVDLVEPFCFSLCPCLSQFNCDARQKRHLALNLFFFLLDILSFTRIHEFSTCIGILFLQHDVN